MASSVLHYIISARVAEQIHINNLNKFLLGAVIAPDTGTKEDGSYQKLHFFENCYDTHRRGINWQNFAVQNAEKMSEDYYLGYYCHLIEDSVWYSDFFDKYIRIYPQGIREVKFPAVYRDYARLNYLLKIEFGLSYIPFKITDIPDTSIEPDRIRHMVESVNTQFDAPECSKEDLEIIPWTFITEYIDKCAKLCKNEISALKGTALHADPKSFFVDLRE